jgi:hypothetical protein
MSSYRCRNVVRARYLAESAQPGRTTAALPGPAVGDALLSCPGRSTRPSWPAAAGTRKAAAAARSGPGARLPRGAGRAHRQAGSGFGSPRRLGLGT